ncbi:MAG: alpha/beta hydrolase family protein [Planctomycetota bacterium]
MSFPVRLRIVMVLLVAMTLATVLGGCANGGYLNVPLPTLGGKFVWADQLAADGWKVQQHALTGHHRLLDPSSIRRAWGSRSHCERELEMRSADSAEDPCPAGDLVILLHGAFRSSGSLRAMEQHLQEAGYRTIAVNYPSVLRPLPSHASQVDALLDRVEAERVHFVTHSLGGLVVRQLLGVTSRGSKWRERIELGRVCMLFPPNQGAYKANLWRHRWWYRAAFGPVSDWLTSEWAQLLPAPPCPFGVIAGGRGDGRGWSGVIPGDDDGTVGVEETKLDGMEDHIVFRAHHTFGMDAPEVLAACARYLETGSFRDDTSNAGGR